MQVLWRNAGMWLWVAVVQLITIVMIVGYASPDELDRYYYATDFLYLPSLFEDVFVDGGHLTDWTITPAPYFFPDMVLYFIVYGITRNVGISIILFSWIQLLIVERLFQKLLTFIVFDAKARRRIWLYSVLALQAFLAAVLFYRNDGFISNQLLTPTCHLGLVMMVLGSMMLFLHWQQTGRTKYLAGLFICIWLAVLSDRLFMIQFMVPVSLWLLLFWGGRQPAKVLVVLVLSGLAGWYSFKLIQHNIIHIPEVKNAGVSWRESWINTGRHVAELWRYYTSFRFILIITALALVVLPLAIWFIKPSAKRALLFLWLVVLVSLVAPVSMGFIHGLDTIRYVNTGFVAGCLSFGFTVHACKITRLPWMASATWIVYLLVLFVFYKRVPDMSRLSHFMYYKPDYVKLITEHSGELKNGLANYWTTKQVYILGEKKNRVLSVLPNVQPYLYQMNKAWLFKTDANKTAVFNFTIDIKNEEVLGPVLKEWTVNNHTIYMYEDFIFAEQGNEYKMIKP